MVSLKRKESGFTIVELLIVIVVIGILAALVITTFNGIQQKGRDTERETDIKALHSQLEAYYAQNGRYPTLGNMQDRTWVATNLKGLDMDALKDPKWTTADSCKDGGNLPVLGAAGIRCYGYAPTDTLNAACDNSTNECGKYVLTATLEGTINGSGTYTKNSLNN
jgi:prepilin-type N-terminal cleavage/methylation domain-containing protein